MWRHTCGHPELTQPGSFPLGAHGAPPEEGPCESSTAPCQPCSLEILMEDAQLFLIAIVATTPLPEV